MPKSKTIGFQSTLSTTSFCSECQGRYVAGQLQSPILFDHMSTCSLGDAIAGVRLSDMDRLKVAGEGARKLIDAEMTLLQDRGATVSEDARAWVSWGQVRYTGVAYASA